MEEARLNITHKRPTLVLDQRFVVTNDLQFNEKVQLEAEIEVESMKTEPDGDGNEMATVTFLVTKAEKSQGKII